MPLLDATSSTPIYAVARTVRFPFLPYLPLFLLSLATFPVAPPVVTMTAVDSAVAVSAAVTTHPFLPHPLSHLIYLLSSVKVNGRGGAQDGSAGGGRAGRGAGRRKGHTRNISYSQEEQKKEGEGARRVRDTEGGEEEGDTKSLRHGR